MKIILFLLGVSIVIVIFLFLSGKIKFAKKNKKAVSKTTSTSKASSDKTKTKKSISFWNVIAGIAGIIGILIAILIVVWLLLWIGNTYKKLSSPKSKTEQVRKAKLPYSYEKTYTLTKGKVIRVKIPMRYSVEYSNPGFPYWKQAENCDSILIGGGLPYVRQSEHARYFNLSCYEKEVTVTCYFTRNR